MKSIVFLLLSFNVAFTADIPFINQVRSLHQKAATEEKYCKELIKLLELYNENSHPLLLGYKASAIMMMAKYAFSPFTKLAYFKKGKKLLDKAIAKDNHSIELRFLRFAAQTNAPSFLGYNDQIDSDKYFLLQSLVKVTDPNLKKIIILYMNKSYYLTADQKKIYNERDVDISR